MSQKLSRELNAAASEPAILAILNQGENYGYAIIQKIRVRSNERMQWTEGMLYPVLHRMEAKGLIRSRWVDGEGGPRRKFYKITAKGGKKLTAAKEEWATINGTLNSLWNERVANV
jgi:DNA-binding PadR family transcriptional regulator